MHKQLSQEGNQGACSQSLGLTAGKSSKFKCNSWRAPASRMKPVLAPRGSTTRSLSLGGQVK